MSSSQGSQPGPNAQGGNGQAADPSMEDILASIRRILSDDGSSGQAGTAATLPPALAQAQRNVLSLDSTMLVREPQATQPIAAGTPLAALNTIVPPVMEPPVTQAPAAAPMPPPAPAPEPVPVQPHAPMHVAHVTHSSIAAPAPMVAPMSVSAPEPSGLVAASTAAAASASVSELMRTLAAERQQAAQPAPQTVPVYRGGPTLEDIVRDEMRPILKAWLDANLPPMVERLVRLEIERVVTRSVG